jgi:hypothetical protein
MLSPWRLRSQMRSRQRIRRMKRYMGLKSKRIFLTENKENDKFVHILKINDLNKKEKNDKFVLQINKIKSS